MTMKIEFKHIFERGIHKVEIVKFKALPKDVLPLDYTNPDVFPKCYTQDVFGTKTLFVQDANGSKCLRTENFKVGEVISLETKEWLVATVCAAGHRLYRINKVLAKERAEWEGKKEIHTF